MFARNWNSFGFLLGRSSPLVFKRCKTSTAKEIIDLCISSNNDIHVSKFKKLIESTGVTMGDPRLQSMVDSLNTMKTRKQGSESIEDINAFERLVDENIVILSKLIKKDLVIPQFDDFCNEMERIYNECKSNEDGQVACYIPQLARYSNDNWAMSICTVDGQRFSLGNVETPFTMQSCSKPFTYGICLNELGEETVRRYVGHEPSGRNFNEICLDSHNKPHNPMLNAGAIMCSALCSTLIEPKMKNSEKFDYVLSYMKNIAGGSFVGFNNAVFLSERETADRNYAMAYYMKENRCFPPKTQLPNIMDLYFQTCSMEVTTESLAVMGATLANGGICPTTAHKVLNPESVRDILSLMFTCGMYNYSGEFAFEVGLPAKSGVSGALILVIPNVMGIGLWSPPLDEKGNSVRGIQFCELLVDKFNFHRFDNLLHSEKKSDPRRNIYEQKGTKVVSLLFAAQCGDTTALKRMHLKGQDLNECDYDGRTALHVSAAEGHIECVNFLVNVAKVKIDVEDRWGFTPKDEATRFGHDSVFAVLSAAAGE